MDEEIINGLLSKLFLEHPVKSIERLPCANVNTRIRPVLGCPREGKFACGACGLVSYCSKVGAGTSY